MKLRDYQRVALSACCVLAAALLADEPGRGKTAVAVVLRPDATLGAGRLPRVAAAELAAEMALVAIRADSRAGS